MQNGNIRRNFHVGRYLCKRHGGESDYKPIPREFSKKQTKRHRKVEFTKSTKLDQTKKAVKSFQVKKQKDSPKTKEYIEETRDM